MKRNTVKAQILIFAIIVLLGLVAIFTFISALSVRPGATPIMRRVFWQVDNREATTATLGQTVKAHVVIEATEQYTGSIVVKIRKDLRWWFDSDFHVSTIPVDLMGGEQKEIQLNFTPDEASGGSFRGYFVEVEFLATRTSWLMESSYPPRLEVTEQD